MSEQREETDKLDPEITQASDKTSRFGMAHESQSPEVEKLESPAPAENKARFRGPAQLCLYRASALISFLETGLYTF